MAIVSFFNWLKGLNVNASPFVMGQDSMTVQNGCLISKKLGAVVKDVGYKRVGSAASSAKAITGLFDFRQSPDIQKILRTKNNDAGTNLLLQYNNAGTWTDINVGTSYDLFEDAKVEMEKFIGYCFIVGYDSTDGVFLPNGSLTGTTFSTSTNVTDMAQAKIIKKYRSRLYVANCYYSGSAYSYRVYFSNIPSAGAITWTPATDFFDIDSFEPITGLGENWDRLIVFTDTEAYLYNQSEKKKVWDIGCSSQRSIRNFGAFIIWANDDGVWYSSGGQPQCLSGAVEDFIKAASDPRNFIAEVVDQEYTLYIGTVTVDGYVYENCELTFDFRTQAWRTRENAHDFTCYARVYDSGKFKRFIGSSIGEVYEKGKHTDSTLLKTDGWIDANNIGSPIQSNFELAPVFIEGMGAEVGINNFFAYANRAQNLELSYRIVDKNDRVLTPYMQIGKLEEYLSTFEIPIGEGVMLQIAGNEYGSNEYWSFYGFDMDLTKKSDLIKKK